MKNSENHFLILLFVVVAEFSSASGSFTILQDSTSNNPLLGSSPSVSVGGRPTREKRDTTALLLRNINDRLYTVEDHMTASNATLEKLEGFLSALGFFPQSNALNANPCKGSKSTRRRQRVLDGETVDSNYSPEEESSANNDAIDDEDDDNEWTLIGSSTCVKVINGFYTYGEAVLLCRDELRIGRDIAYPEVARIDSIGKQNALLGLLRTHLPSVTGVWVDLSESAVNNRRVLPSPAGSSQQCTELRNDRTRARQGTGHVPWANVDCVRTNSIVCERTLPISYAEIVRSHLGRVDADKELDKQLKRTELETQRIITQLNSNLEELEVGLSQMNITTSQEQVVLKTKMDNFQLWKQRKEEQSTADSLKIKQLSDQVKDLNEKDIASNQNLGLLQEQIETKLEELQRWKRLKEEQGTADSLKIKQLSDQVKDLNRKDLANEQKLILLQEQIETLSHTKLEELQRWKRLKEEQGTADSLKIKQLSDQVKDLNRKDLANDQKLILLQEQVQQLDSWKSNQLISYPTYPTTTSQMPRTSRRYVGNSIAVYKNGEATSTTESDPYDNWME